MDEYLRPTFFLDFEDPSVAQLAESLKKATPQETIVALFEWVRDEIRYDPMTAMDPEDGYRASAILARGSGYCVQKAVLLAALVRAAGTPARLGFADVRNHKSPKWLQDLMRTNLFVFHGYTEFYLDGDWVKATPAFDREATRKAGALLVELDGTNDAMLHPVDPQGHPHIEYIRDRGHYADCPVEEIHRALLQVYGDMRPA